MGPRRVRLQAETSATGPEVDLGSNEEVFWFWVNRNEPPAVYFDRHSQRAGSAAQKGAHLCVVEKCKALTDNGPLLGFEAYLNASFGKLKYYCLLFFVALGLYFFSPTAGLILSLLNAVAFVLDFMTYRVVLGSFPGPLTKSWTVEAVLEPQGEVKSTLVFSGHIDSVYEFK